MNTLAETETGHFVISLAQNFDFESHKTFRSAVKEAMTQHPKSLKLDFSEVTYIDSSGLGMLMLAKHEADTNNCKLAIINLNNSHARKVLELVRFDQLLTVEHD